MTLVQRALTVICTLQVWVMREGASSDWTSRGSNRTGCTWRCRDHEVQASIELQTAYW